MKTKHHDRLRGAPQESSLRIAQRGMPTPFVFRWGFPITVFDDIAQTGDDVLKHPPRKPGADPGDQASAGHEYLNSTASRVQKQDRALNHVTCNRT